MIKKIFNQRKR